MNRLIEHKKSTLTITVYMLIFMTMFAASGTMLGTLMPELIRHYTLKLSQAGLATTFQSLGGILSLFFGGVLADRMSKLNLIIIVFAVFSVLLCVIGLVPAYVLLLLILFIFGICTSMMNLVITAYISDLYPQKRGLYVSLLHTFYGIGSFIGPIYTTSMLNYGFEWNMAFYDQGILYACVTVSFTLLLLFLLNPPHTGQTHKNKAKAGASYFDVLKDKKMILLCITGFLYMGHQTSINVWLPTYLTGYLHYDRSFMGFVMTFYWIGMVIGRLVFSFLSVKIDIRKYILTGSLAGSAALLIAIFVNDPGAWITTVTVTGIFTGAMFPMFLVIVCEWHPEKSASASSLVCLSSTMGGMVFPWLIGNIAEFASFKLAILLPVVNLLLVFALAKIGGFSTGRESIEIAAGQV